ncbi:MAG: thiamine diphosphokinase [Clostridiales bacterium]|nr:thiamine diphosphokinase [Clostridiales bacterium]
MKGLIICGGRIKDKEFLRNYTKDVDFVICADRGGLYAKDMDIMPDLLLGDMDSIPGCILEEYKNKKVDMTLYPSEKDMTDSEIAILRAVEMGADELIIMGALGSRLDHSLANICMLKKLVDMHIKATIVDENNEITLIDNELELKKDDEYMLSLLPLTPKVTGVTLKGLKYTLEDGTLEMGTSLGVSNEFEDDVAKITIKDGLLLVIKSKD